MTYIYSLQSEWLKTKRSAGSWLTLIGGAFLPLLFLIGFLVKHQTIDALSKSGLNSWLLYNHRLWEFMGVFFLPMGIVLAASLITQMEYKNNTWKQLHTTPQSYSTIFSAKFSAILLMTLKFFVFFNIGLLISAIVPCLIFNGALPKGSLPILELLKLNTHFFIACLPILAMQYLLSLQFKNFIASIGIGMVAVIASIILLQTTKYAWLSPYSYCTMLGLGNKVTPRNMNVDALALCSFGIIIIVAFILYRFKREKG